MDIKSHRMEFKTPGQQLVYERILPWMHDLFGDALVVFEDEPLFIVNLGSAVASTPYDDF
jgi:hypothetical protein